MIDKKNYYKMEYIVWLYYILLWYNYSIYYGI